MNLSKNIKVTTCLDYASGTASRNGAALDMEGWDGVLAIIKHATIAVSAVGDFHWEQGAQSNLSDAADLLGTAMAVAADDDNEVWVADLYRPRERYVRGVITKNGSNAQAETVIYIQYKGSKCPVSNAGADKYELHVSPAEGTK
jgi:hypothetical protein